MFNTVILLQCLTLLDISSNGTSIVDVRLQYLVYIRIRKHIGDKAVSEISILPPTFLIFFCPFFFFFAFSLRA